MHIKGGCAVSTSSLQSCHLQTTPLDISVGCLSSEQVNPHLEGPPSHDCMQGSENTGSKQTSDLKMPKFKKAFTKGGMERASGDNDRNSGMGIGHSTEEGTKKRTSHLNFPT